MRQAAPSPDEIDAAQNWAERASSPSWARRIVWGFTVLYENCADKSLDYLAMNPELMAAKKAKEVQPELLEALEAISDAASFESNSFDPTLDELDALLTARGKAHAAIARAKGMV